MTTFGLIGAGGVGAAHAIAARNLGWELRWVIDTDAAVLDRYQANSVLVNSWGYIGSEECELNDDIQLFSAIPATPVKPVDVAVIAVPHFWHDHYVYWAAANASYVLIEKPGFINPAIVCASQMHFGYKWLYHPDLYGLLTADGLQTIMQMHNYPPSRSWTDNIILDFGSHLLSYLTVYFGVLDLEKIELVIYRAGYLFFRYDGIECHAAYRPLDEGIPIWQGHDVNRLINQQLEVIVNAQVVGWREDIFKLQLNWIVSGRPPLIDANQSKSIDLGLAKLMAMALGQR